MLVNITACICFLIVISILFVDFNSKEKLDTIDNKCFQNLSKTCVLGLIIETLFYFFVILGINVNSNFMLLMGKIIFVYYIVYMYFFITYVYAVCKNIITKNKKFSKFKTITFIIMLILSLIIISSSYKFIATSFYVYPVGLATNLSYLNGCIGLLFVTIVCIIDHKKIDRKKITPIISCIFGAIISIYVQYNFRELLLLIPTHAISIIFMYFSIENPDIKLLRQMELAKEQAEKANKAKSDFLSSMSHEIRTPLNAIVGLSNDIIENDDGASKVVLDDAKDIVEASNTLLEIVGNILDISKIESGKLEITSCKYNFKQELETLAKINKVRIGEKNIDYKVEIAPDIPYELIGDRVHIKEILNNLISNAIKYTESGKVLIRAKCINQKDKCNLIVSVQDTGRGIKKEDINKLFTKFERLNVERNTTIEGTGLGLAITKQLVEMMGGKINVQSNYGFGSMFVVNIPQKISIMNKPIDEDTLVRTGRLFSKDVANNKLQGSKVNDIGHKKVLLVDDNNLNLKVAHKAMQSFDFEIVDAHDGEEAIEIYNKTKDYDIIFMDIMMPNMGGETALRNLKLDPTFKTPVIALTADAVEGSSEKYISEGFKDYLAKPFSKEDIIDVINKLF